MSNKKHLIIVIEGIDGSGKETQSKLLKENLIRDNQKVIVQSFPNYQSEGCQPVKLYLKGALGEKATDVNAYQSSVLFAVDRFCTMRQLTQSLESNSIIIFDRYVSSNMLHQGGKIQDKKELEKFLKWLDNFEFNTMALPRPDIIFFLNMPVEKSIELAHHRMKLKTGDEKDIHECDNSHLLHAYETGKYICDMFNWSKIEYCKENGELKSPEEISNEIYMKVKKKISEKFGN